MENEYQENGQTTETSITLEQIAELINQNKQETINMINGAINKVKKENKSIEEKVTELFGLIESKTQDQPTTDNIAPNESVSNNTPVVNNEESKLLSQVELLQKQIDKLRQENELKEQERLQILAETTKEKATNKFLDAVREKVANPNHFLGSLIFEDRVKYDPDRGDFVIEVKNQYGEIEAKSPLDEIDSILKDPSYKSHLPSRPGNGLNSQPPTNQVSRTQSNLGSEIPQSLLTDPNFIGKMFSDLPVN